MRSERGPARSVRARSSSSGAAAAASDRGHDGRQSRRSCSSTNSTAPTRSSRRTCSRSSRTSRSGSGDWARCVPKQPPIADHHLEPDPRGPRRVEAPLSLPLDRLSDAARRSSRIVLAQVPGGPGAAGPRGRRLRPPPPRGRPHEGPRDRRDARLGGGPARAGARPSWPPRASPTPDARRRPQVRGGHPPDPRRRRPPPTWSEVGASAGGSNDAADRSRRRAIARSVATPSTAGLLRQAVGFGRALRAAGLTSTSGAADRLRPSPDAHGHRREGEVRAAGATVFVRRRDEREVVRQGIRPMVAHAAGRSAERRPAATMTVRRRRPPEPERERARPAPATSGGAEGQGSVSRHRGSRGRAATRATRRSRPTVHHAPDAYSAAEVLRHREFDRMTAGQVLRDAERLIDLLDPASSPPDPPATSSTTSAPGRAATMFRRNLRTVARCRTGSGAVPTRRPRKIVVLCRHHAARWSATRGCCCGSSRRCRRRPGADRVIRVRDQLTRVTRLMRERDLYAALARWPTP